MKKLLFFLVVVTSLWACEEDEKETPKDYGMKTFKAELDYSSSMPPGGGMPVSTYATQAFFKFDKADPTVHIGEKGTDSYTAYNMVNGVDGEEYNITTDVEGWDMVFTAYRKNLMSPDNPYIRDLAGVLINPSVVQIAKIEYTDSEDPEAISKAFADLKIENLNNPTYNSEIDVIGHNWKSVDMNTGFFTVHTNLFYIIKHTSGDAYKLRFVGFQAANDKTDRFISIEYALMQ
ncbi:MAG: hypothetical protein JEZ14_19985 [Marinilabiliaceae bacterium]|nr:hypothetical protein [Marinilabiliaceae bacterium]